MSFKRVALSLSVLALMALSAPFATSADAPAAAPTGASIGVIDYQKLMVGYAKAKDFYNKDVAKRKELKDLRDSLAEELKKAKNSRRLSKKCSKTN